MGLKSGFKVIPIDSEYSRFRAQELLPKVEKLQDLVRGKSDAWKRANKETMAELKDLQFEFGKYMILRRDKYMISQINRKTPDIVIAGAGHAYAIAEALGIKKTLLIGSEVSRKGFLNVLAIERKRKELARAEHEKRVRLRLMRRKLKG